jgi:hypothetical protein
MAGLSDVPCCALDHVYVKCVLGMTRLASSLSGRSNLNLNITGVANGMSECIALLSLLLLQSTNGLGIALLKYCFLGGSASLTWVPLLTL